MRERGCFPTVSSGVQDTSICVGLMIGFVGVVALLGIDLRGNTEELIGAGAVLTYSTRVESPAVYHRPVGVVPAVVARSSDRYRAQVAVAVTGAQLRFIVTVLSGFGFGTRRATGRTGGVGTQDE